jgi:hypothetical protein
LEGRQTSEAETQWGLRTKRGAALVEEFVIFPCFDDNDDDKGDNALRLDRVETAMVKDSECRINGLPRVIMQTDLAVTFIKSRYNYYM